MVFHVFLKQKEKESKRSRPKGGLCSLKEFLRALRLQILFDCLIAQEWQADEEEDLVFFFFGGGGGGEDGPKNSFFFFLTVLL